MTAKYCPICGLHASFQINYHLINSLHSSLPESTERLIAYHATAHEWHVPGTSLPSKPSTAATSEGQQRSNIRRSATALSN
jgi:hypothetical protein